MQNEFTAVLAGLIKSNKNDARAAYEEFNKGVQEKFEQGRAPNAGYNILIGSFSKLVPMQESLDKLKMARKEIADPVIDNLIYDFSSIMNEIVGQEVYEMPDVINDDSKTEAFKYKQALIKINNKLPNTNGDTRKSLLWTINAIHQTLADLEAKEAQKQ